MLFNILYATTNQIHAGMMEGGWDRPSNYARTLWEHDDNNEPLSEGNIDNNDKEYGDDGDIPDDNNDKYPVGV
jgi:hypothetical protein